MTSNAKRNGPQATPGAVSSDQTTSREEHPQHIESPRIPHLSAAEIAMARPLYLLVVKTPGERVMRRTYLSLPAAEKAVKRAQARGSAATLELHRVVPYTVGRELHGIDGDPL